MAREISAAVIAESLKDQGAKPFLLVKLSFDGGVFLAWSGRGNIVFNSETYTGIGDLGRVAEIEEGIQQRAFGISLELSGIPLATIALALQEELQGRLAQIWIGFLDSNYAMIATPSLLFEGRLNTMDIELGKEAKIAVTAESKLIDWNRPRVRRYTDADQQEAFPGDLGFQYVSTTTDKEIVWGGTVAGGQTGGGVVASGQGGSGTGTSTREVGGGGQ